MTCLASMVAPSLTNPCRLFMGAPIGRPIRCGPRPKGKNAWMAPSASTTATRELGRCLPTACAKVREKKGFCSSGDDFWKRVHRLASVGPKSPGRTTVTRMRNHLLSLINHEACRHATKTDGDRRQRYRTV